MSFCLLKHYHLSINLSHFLDAYQGPYKDKFYYWTGLQLLIRAVFFGLLSLDKEINLMVGIILLGVLGGMTGIMQPFKNKYKNYQEFRAAPIPDFTNTSSTKYCC